MLSVFSIFLCTPFCVVADTQFSLIDDRGRSIHLERSARRIISLAPHITELIFAAGAGDKIVGVSSHSDYPNAAMLVPSVGDSFGLDLEKIITLRPDLVIAWRNGNTQADIERIEKLGLTVFVTEASKLEDIPRLLRTTGRLAGTLIFAEKAADAYEKELQQIKEKYTHRQQIRVLQLIWHQPLMSINGNHIISDMINICGGVNVLASASSLVPAISAESLLANDPQVIISSVSLKSNEVQAEDLWRKFSHIKAVKNKHLFFIHPDLIHRQSPRTLLAVKAICKNLESARRG